MSLHIWISFCALVALMVSTPGPSVLIGMSHSMRYGPVPTLLTALGDVTANMIQMIIAAVGLGAILATSATAFQAVKWVGVAFLLAMGLVAFFRKPAAGNPKNDIETNKVAGREPARPFKMFSQGFLVAAGNPKAIAFFGALFPQFIDATHPLMPQLVVLGVTFVIFDYTAVMVYAAAASRITPWVTRHGGNRAIGRFSGGVLIIAAMLLSLIDAPGSFAGEK
ncbi:LysE family translocator [Thalassospira mesophila]|uniref:Homoserine lactone transporter n=1 Tax=Thalassospira mesophila TaxID=1293891 RepID=A0A1Y2L705_9PROT|nr:LysE family translocator [Thalassospira mesophila]OSQ40619.1 homoserine lactone transporter [Thalassospira mesophila]